VAAAELGGGARVEGRRRIVLWRLREKEERVFLSSLMSTFLNNKPIIKLKNNEMKFLS
jgi:hypothetical protein